MIDSPFRVFEPFKDRVRVRMLTKADAVKNDVDIARALGTDLSHMASLHQMHGPRGVRVDGPTSRERQADAFYSSVPGLTLTIRMADCQTFVIYDPRHHVAGLIHAGWRGLTAGVMYAIKDLGSEWGSAPEDLIIGAGPALCFACSKFTDPRTELKGFPEELIAGRSANLRAEADRELHEQGVAREHYERIQDCTKCMPETYWTYRGGDKESVIAGNTNVLSIELL